MRKRTIILGALGVLVLSGAAALALLHEPRPDRGEGSEAADALARRVQQATGLEAWRKTRSVRFEFARRNAYEWDRANGRVKVRFDGQEVELDTETEQATNGASPELAREAYKRFINDTYWLYPFDGFFDDSVHRSIIEVDGREGLLIEYGAGGVTPGDAYLWHIGEDGRPTSYRMWVGIIPIGGLEVTWEDWTQVDSGAWISTRHELQPGPTIHITGLTAE